MANHQFRFQGGGMVEILLASFFKRQMLEITIVGVVLQQHYVIFTDGVYDVPDYRCLSGSAASGYANNKWFQMLD